MDKEVKGQVKIADDVIASIAGTAALEAEGVSSLAGANTVMSKLDLGKKSNNKGVTLQVDKKDVKIDIKLNVLHGCKIKDCASDVQLRIKEAVETMTGLSVSCVNVMVVGIEFEKNQPEYKAD